MSGTFASAIHSYSDCADLYDEERNLRSCWGRLTDTLTGQLQPPSGHSTIVDVGCGTGRAMEVLARKSLRPLIGIEPAPRMRHRAVHNLSAWPGVHLMEGRFEDLPLPDRSVDYLYSLLAFHWTLDVRRAVSELSRVLKPGARMDLWFPGRRTGHEFTAVTLPIFHRRFGRHWLREAAARRQHFCHASTLDLFQPHFQRLEVEESLQCYWDDLQGHWSWWQARAVAHLPSIEPAHREACDQEIRQAMQSLATSQGIPYTIHLIRVSAIA